MKKKMKRKEKRYQSKEERTLEWVSLFLFKTIRSLGREKEKNKFRVLKSSFFSLLGSHPSLSLSLSPLSLSILLPSSSL